MCFLCFIKEHIIKHFATTTLAQKHDIKDKKKKTKDVSPCILKLRS